MACALLAVDFAECLLVLAKGRIDFPRGMIDEVVRSFRVDFDRHFGLTQDDAGNLLTLIESADAGADSTLGNIACRILEQSCSLANDEAQVWEPSLASLGDPEFWVDWLGHNPEEVARRQELRLPFRRLLSRRPPPRPQDVLDFLDEVGLSGDILMQTTRPGLASSVSRPGWTEGLFSFRMVASKARVQKGFQTLGIIEVSGSSRCFFVCDQQFYGKDFQGDSINRHFHG